jgi:undecaprenyl-diphosphatase
MSIVLASMVSYSLIRQIRRDAVKNSLYAIMFALAVCIGLSRVYLNVHWASDVLAGIFAGSFWATFTIAVYELAIWYIKRSKRKHELPNVL